MSTQTDPWAALGRALAAPFDPAVVRWKPQSTKGGNGRALAVAYVGAAEVQERLDEAAGPGNWQDAYQVFPDGSVGCRLSVRVPGGEWVTKEDVGSPSEQPDGGDRLKAAFSDALKRAAIKFGVARYIRKLPLVWCDYDPVKKQFTQTPQLPAWALPGDYQPADNPEALRAIEADYRGAKTGREVSAVHAKVKDAIRRGVLSPADQTAVRGYAVAAADRVRGQTAAPPPGHAHEGDDDQPIDYA